MIIIDYIRFKLFRKRIKKILSERLRKKIGNYKVDTSTFIINGVRAEDSKGRTRFVAKEDFDFYLKIIEEVLR